MSRLMPCSFENILQVRNARTSTYFGMRSLPMESLVSYEIDRHRLLWRVNIRVALREHMIGIERLSNVRTLPTYYFSFRRQFIESLCVSTSEIQWFHSSTCNGNRCMAEKWLTFSKLSMSHMFLNRSSTWILRWTSERESSEHRSTSF